MDEEEICRDVMALDPGIRSAMIINERGHVKAGGMKPGLQPLEKQKKDEMIFTEIALRVRMRRSFDSEFGRVLFSMSYREKVIIMSFPLLNNELMLVSMEKDVDFQNTPFRIRERLEPLVRADDS